MGWCWCWCLDIVFGRSLEHSLSEHLMCRAVAYPNSVYQSRARCTTLPL